MGNRRAFDSKLASYAAERRPQPEACLLLLDLDHFKQVNDQHGHPAGDEVLRRLCDVLRHYTRVTDEIFRYGGEEFGVARMHLNAAFDQARVPDCLHRDALKHQPANIGPIAVLGR